MSIVTQQCWEPCFQNLATDMNRPALQEILKAGLGMKRLKDINAATGVTFLLDSTIATACPSSSSHHSSSSSSSSSSSDSSSSSSSDSSSSSSSSGSSMSSEILEDVLFGESTSAIWTMQLQMMAIFAAMMGTQRVFPVQFNENAAWSCKEYSCLDCCQTITLVKGTYLTPLQVNASSCNDGLVEPACRMGYHAINNYCPATVTNAAFANNMTVAILNSNAHHHVHKRGNFRDYSPCDNYFHYRYAVGLHLAHNDDLVRFESRDDFHNMVNDDALTRTVVDSLFNCISSRCCPTAGVIATPLTTCKVAYGDAGETLSVVTAINPLG